MTETPIPVEALPPLYTAVGGLVINWAIADSIVTKIVAVIYQSAGGKQHDPIIRLEFNRRAKFLRLCASRIDALAPFRGDIDQVLTKARALTPIRDFVIHGSLSAYVSATQAYTFARIDIDRPGSIHVVNKLTTTLSDLRGATIDIQQVNRSAFVLFDRLKETFLR